MTPPAVDLVVNCFERNYREVLAPGFFPRVAGENAFPFAGRVALVNNVDDLDDARSRAQALLDAGEITEVLVVEERLDAALRTTGLTRAHLGRTPHFSDCALVAVTAPGAPWIVYWDADNHLVEPVDWITPSVALMEHDRRVLIANPNNQHHPVPDRTTPELHDGFALGYGFSDVVFLARRAELAAPIYRARTVAALRFPLAHVAHIFEARVDAHMRRRRRLRAYHLGSCYFHAEAGIGASHPAHDGIERLRRMAYQGALVAVRATPPRLRPEHLRDL